MIELAKKQSINLNKGDKTLSHVRVCLGWQTPETVNGFEYDLDVTAFCLKDGRMLFEKSFVFYNNKVTPCGGLNYGGDDRKGSSDGSDCETIDVDLNKLNSSYDEVSFIVSIYDYEARKQNFGSCRNAYLRIVDIDSGDVIAMFRLNEDYKDSVSIQVGSLTKQNGEWSFTAVGVGYNKDLEDYLKVYWY